MCSFYEDRIGLWISGNLYKHSTKHIKQSREGLINFFSEAVKVSFGGGGMFVQC